MIVYHQDPATGWYLEADPEQWRAIYKLVQTGRDNLPYDALVGSGKPFTRSAWEDLRERLVVAGLASRTKTGQVILNDQGRGMVRYWASPTPSTK
jgi:hypothetical protein